MIELEQKKLKLFSLYIISSIYKQLKYFPIKNLIKKIDSFIFKYGIEELSLEHFQFFIKKQIINITIIMKGDE
jgi:hypothetical protein